MNTIISITEKYFEYCKSQKRLDDKTIKAYRVDLQQFTTFFDNCLWQLKNRSLGSLKIQSVYWGLGV